MVEQHADRRYVDSAKEAFGGLVVKGSGVPGIFQFVQAPFDEVSAAGRVCGRRPTRSLRDFRIRITGTTLRASAVFRT